VIRLSAFDWLAELEFLAVALIAHSESEIAKNGYALAHQAL
jgi:hypothetical protein